MTHEEGETRMINDFGNTGKKKYLPKRLQV